MWIHAITAGIEKFGMRHTFRFSQELALSGQGGAQKQHIAILFVESHCGRSYRGGSCVFWAERQRMTQASGDDGNGSCHVNLP